MMTQTLHAGAAENVYVQSMREKALQHAMSKTISGHLIPASISATSENPFRAGAHSGPRWC